MAREFCIEHIITEPKKQDKLLRVIEDKLYKLKMKKKHQLQS